MDPSVPSARRLGPGARFFIYGLIGWCVECLFTCVMDLATGDGDLRLKGYSYLWMHPIWGGTALACERLAFELMRRRVGFFTRGFVYMCVCFGVEYCAGALLSQLIGRCPWDYSGAIWSVNGYIRLDYAPFWLLCGWGGEVTCGWVRRLRITVLDPRAPVPAHVAALTRERRAGSRFPA